MSCYRVDISLPLDHADDAGKIRAAAARKLAIDGGQISEIRHIRRSVDARKGMVRINHALAVYTDAYAKGGTVYEPAYWQPPEQVVYDGVQPVVVGAGPCGLFAALVLAEAGLKPILLERGRPTAQRTKQVEAFFSDAGHDPESNVLFGDGGAGAFSDGKLTWRGKDARGRYVLRTMVAHGAPDDILFMAKPHVGTDRMRKVIAGIRAAIERAGGQIINGARLDGLATSGGTLTGVRYTQGGLATSMDTSACIIAIGHSARDTYTMLHAAGVAMEPKAFAAGLRIEHRQQWLDEAQYGQYAGHPALGHAEYALTAKAGGRGVYTFCMCPGGMVIPSVSEEGCLCVNGMSYRKRGMENSNSALIAQLNPADWGGDTLGGVEFQRKYERIAYEYAGYTAPVQRLGDFMDGRVSSGFGHVLPSYPRGTAFADLNNMLPGFISAAIKKALPQMDSRLKGFAHPDALLTGVEMRSSAPLRILRGGDMQSLNLSGLYPAGEGAGYAGGIMSAAVDGIKAAEQLIINIIRV